MPFRSSRPLAPPVRPITAWLNGCPCLAAEITGLIRRNRSTKPWNVLWRVRPARAATVLLAQRMVTTSCRADHPSLINAPGPAPARKTPLSASQGYAVPLIVTGTSPVIQPEEEEGAGATARDAVLAGVKLTCYAQKMSSC